MFTMVRLMGDPKTAPKTPEALWQLPGDEDSGNVMNDDEMREIFNDKSYRKYFGSDHQILEEFAKIYNIHYTTAYKIVRGQSWKHLNNA